MNKISITLRRQLTVLLCVLVLALSAFVGISAFAVDDTDTTVSEPEILSTPLLPEIQTTAPYYHDAMMTSKGASGHLGLISYNPASTDKMYFEYVVSYISNPDAKFSSGFLRTSYWDPPFYTDGTTSYAAHMKYDYDGTHATPGVALKDLPWMQTGVEYKIEFDKGNASGAGTFKYTIQKKTSAGYEILDLSDYCEWWGDLSTVNTSGDYFGLFFQNVGANTNIYFTQVRYYDANGNDLKVWSNAIDTKTINGVTEKSFSPYNENPVAQEGVATYNVEASNMSDTLFVGNSFAGYGMWGSHTVMEYTVGTATHTYTSMGFAATSADDCDVSQNSVVMTSSETVDLLEAGASYKLIFTYSGAIGNFTVRGTVTKDSETTDLPAFTVENVNGDGGIGHIGLWLSGGGCTYIELTNVRFYEDDGADLSVKTNSASAKVKNSTQEDYEDIELKSIQVTFGVSGENLLDALVCNEVPFETEAGNIVVIEWTAGEYTTGDGSDRRVYICMTSNTEGDYPYSAGGHSSLLVSALLSDVMVEGTKYQAQIEITPVGYNLQCRKEVDGEYESVTSSFTSSKPTGTVGDHVGLYFSDGAKFSGGFNIKIYDKEGNNLGLTSNKETVAISEPTHAITYMVGETTVTDKVGEAYRTYKTSKGISRFAAYSDATTKTYAVGWYSDPELTQKITSVARMSRNNEFTVYAKMEKWQYNIIFDANSDDADGEMDDMQVTTGENVTFDANEFTLTGYEFKGWSVSPDAETVDYADGATVAVSELELIKDEDDYVYLDANNADLYLYAVWELKTYTVTYVLNGGENNSANPTAFTVNDEFTLEDATKEGAEFIGWYTTATFEENSMVTVISGTENLTLYAKFSDTDIPPQGDDDDNQGGNEQGGKGDDEGCGCGSDVFGFGTLAGGIALLGAALAVTFAKKKRA